MCEGLNRTNSDKWWKIAHLYRGRVCWHPLARKLGLQAGSMTGAAPTRDGITTSVTATADPANRAGKHRENTSGHGGKRTANVSTCNGATATQWGNNPKGSDQMNGAEKPKLQFGGTIHVDNPTGPVGNVGAPANVMPADEQAGPSIDEINAVLLPVSQQHGYCLCLHPFQNVIDFTGTTCKWCLQPVTADQYTPASKEIRTAALHTAYPPGHPYRTDGSAPGA